MNIQKIAAIVVGFFPEINVLDSLLLSLLGQVNHVILIDNGGSNLFLKELPEKHGQIEYLNLGENKGLGYALNEGFRIAISHGCNYIATFDQDSAPPNLMIQGLLNTHLQLEEQGINCAAVAPSFFDRRQGEKIKFPLYKEIDKSIITISSTPSTNKAIEVDVLITSGMLIKSTVWSNIHYDPGLFVDYTDTDWCFRARAAGFRLFVCPNEEMGHALSDAPPIRLFGLSFFEYSPIRRYYYFRNTVLFVRKPYVSNAWKRRLIIGLFIRFFSSILIDKRKLLSLKMICTGIYKGLIEEQGIYK